VQDRLRARRELARHGVGIRVAPQQHQLEEHHADGPDRGVAAEPGQDLLGDDRLHQEQQEGAGEDGGGKEKHREPAKKARL